MPASVGERNWSQEPDASSIRYQEKTAESRTTPRASTGTIVGGLSEELGDKGFFFQELGDRGVDSVAAEVV